MRSPSLPASIPRQTAIYAAALLGLTVVFWIIGPPLFFQGIAAQAVRAVYAGLALACVWRAVLPVAPSAAWRWLTIGAAALVLKSALFPYALRWLNLNPFGRGSVISTALSPLGTLAFYIVGIGGVILVWGVITSPLWLWILKRRRIMREPWNQQQARDKFEAETGYSPPILWHGAPRQHPGPPSVHIRSAFRPDLEFVRSGDLVTKSLLETRSKMPPFILWYQEGWQDGVKREPGMPEKWLSTIDGNPKLGPRDTQMKTFVQLLYRDQSELTLFETTAQEARKLTTGTYGQVTLEGRFYPDNGLTSLTVKGGTPGAMLPQPPRPMETRTTQGSSRAGTGDADAERA